MKNVSITYFATNQWADVPNVISTLMHIYNLAADKPTQYQGREIQRGELITSIAKLSAVVGISTKQTRTAVAKLAASGEITIHAVSCQYTLITVKGQTEGKRKASKGQAKGKRKVTENQGVTRARDNRETPEGQANDEGAAAQPIDYQAVTAREPINFCENKEKRKEPKEKINIYTYLPTYNANEKIFAQNVESELDSILKDETFGFLIHSRCGMERAQIESYIKEFAADMQTRRREWSDRTKLANNFANWLRIKSSIVARQKNLGNTNAPTAAANFSTGGGAYYSNIRAERAAAAQRDNERLQAYILGQRNGTIHTAAYAITDDKLPF